MLINIREFQIITYLGHQLYTFLDVLLQLQGNKLVIEKLTIYDRIGIVKVVLASGFVGEASEALLSPIPSGHLKPGDRCIV